MKTEVTYKIPVGRIGEVTKELAKIQERSSKLNNGVPMFEFAFSDKVKVERFSTDTDEFGRLEAQYEYRDLTISQVVIVHEGWVPIAKIYVVEKEMKVFGSLGKELAGMSDDYLYSAHCDHCKKNLIKVKAFIMQKGSELMRVGSGCMQSLAPANAAAIAYSFDVQDLWSKYLADMTSPVDGIGEGGGRNWFGGGNGGFEGNVVYDKNLVLLVLRAALEQTGGKWVVSQYKQDEDNRNFFGGMTQVLANRGDRTYDIVCDMINKVRKGDLCMLPDDQHIESVNSMFKQVLSSEEASRMHDIKQWSDEAQDMIVVGTRLPDWIEPATIFVESPKVKLIDIFLVKKIAGVMARIDKKIGMKNSQFVGEVGTKIPVEADIIDTKHGMGQYGPWTLYIMRDTNGNMFKKFGTINDRFKQANGLYSFMAPVKGHETFDEVKYTVLGGPFSKMKK